ncbi:hypothetical protein N0V82_000920 [Gnomoniopsis sp. IMI 355080]|nr:hypothetical protein N0V82_000920 [Gnomoniopsis sp. IMI 355080]
MATRLSVPASAGADPRTEAQKLKLPSCRMGRFLKSKLFPKVKNLVGDLTHRGRSAHVVDKQIRFVREQYLPLLEFDVAKSMTKKLAKYAKIKTALQLLRDPVNRLPADVATKADDLYKRFDAMDWDATRPTPASLRAERVFTGGYPPEGHPIWGMHGIMHGIVLERGRRGQPVYRLDDRFTRRDAEVYGHNGLRPGMWFPRQECLRLHGGHSQIERGISGHEYRGAYSIVVSGKYEDIDKDEGNTIYYSAEGAHDKHASRKADVKGNRALRASISSHNPVRVFRRANKSSRFAPPVGIRYDGLYEIVGKEYRYNSGGGRYERFELRRLENIDQPDLDDILHTSPTTQEQADFSRIKAGY